MAIASIARLALTTVHGVGKVSKVVTAGIFIALVASVEAGITRSADLKKRLISNQADGGSLKPQLSAGAFLFLLFCE